MPGHGNQITVRGGIRPHNRVSSIHIPAEASSPGAHSCICTLTAKLITMLHQRCSQSACRVGHNPPARAVACAACAPNRRALITTLTASGLLAVTKDAWAFDSQAAGSYLPPAGIDDLVQYLPAKDKTPALRAGTIRPEERYTFAVPPDLKEQRISNTQTGNFCLPKCGEPWKEVVFEDPKVCRIELLAVPLFKLTNSARANVKDLGTPEQLLVRVGPYITGSYFDEEDVVSATSKKQEDGIDYYVYELNALDSMFGPHIVSAVTTKGEVCYLFVISANDKQWGKNEKTIRKVVDTFRA